MASKVDGRPDIIEIAKTGLLVPPGNSETLTMAIKDLYRNGEMRQVLPENAYSESMR